MKNLRFIVLFVIVSILFTTPALALEHSIVNEVKTISLVDESGKAVTDAHAFVYARINGDMVLLSHDLVNQNGNIEIRDLKFYNKGLNKEAYVNYSVKVFAPGKEIAIYNFSTMDNEQLQRKTFANNEVTLTLKSNLSKESLSSRGSGDFRTIKTGYVNRSIKVVVGELHKIPGMYANYKLKDGQTNTISTMSSISGWDVSGSTTVGSSVTINIDTDEITESSEIMSTYLFELQYWELQERDTDIYDLWHTVQTWDELVPVELLGGAYQGESADGDNESYTAVENNQYGIHYELSLGDTIREGYNIKTFNTGYTYEYEQNKKVIGKASINYGTSSSREVELTMRELPGNDIIAYDRGSDQAIWYFTSR
jgi:hypothetical protein